MKDQAFFPTNDNSKIIIIISVSSAATCLAL